LAAADYVVVPFVPARESLDGLGDLMDTIEEIKQEFNPGLQVIGLLANKVNSRSGFDKSVLAELNSVAPDMLLPIVIHDRTSITRAMASSQPVWYQAHGSSHKLAAKEFRQACDLILNNVFE
jgi:chromosome partitioning protein